MMNNKIAVRKCNEYDLDQIFDLISDIYKKTDGPDVSGKKVLVKPNILTDDDPAKCISTHPVVVEAMIRFLAVKWSYGYGRRFSCSSYSADSKEKNQESVMSAKQRAPNGLISW